MASTTTQHSRSRRSLRGLPCMSERQLDAYLLAKETLRRLRASALSAAPRPTPPNPTV